MSDQQPNDLRKRAEDILRGQPFDVHSMSPDEIERLLRELQIHEIELQLQNEELRTAQRRLEESYRKYANLYDFAPVGYLTLDEHGMVDEANLTITLMLGIGRERLFRQPFVSHVTVPHKRLFFDHQRRLFETQSPQRVELQLVKYESTPFYVQLDSTIAFNGSGASPVRAHMVIADIDERKQIAIAEYEQRLFAESLRSIAQVLNGTLNLEEVLTLILDNVNSVVQHDVAEVLLFEAGSARVVGSKGYDAHELSGNIDTMSLPIAETANLSQLITTGQPVLLPDIQTDPHWNFVINKRQMHAYLGVPIRLEAHVIGCLNVFNRQPDYYTPTHAERLSAFAGQTATAIRNAQLFHQAQQVAVYQERQRLARDLHDAVSQTLFSASMIAEALPQLSERGPEALANNLDKLLVLTRGAMAEMRALLLELRPETLERHSLSELLLQLTKAMQGRKQIAVDLHLAHEPALSSGVKEAIYRVAQEALNNVMKHSQATEVSLRMDGSPQQLTLTIRDNGRGFDMQRITAGIGLYSMQERAHDIEAELRITSAPNKGTAVVLVWERTP